MAIFRLGMKSVALVLLMSISAPSDAALTKEVVYYYTDPQGTVLATADSSGAIISQTDRRPFGATALGSSDASFRRQEFKRSRVLART